MQLSPLQLLEYSFEGISVLPVDGYSPEENFSPGLVFYPGKLALSADTGLAHLKDEEKYSDYGVRLTLRVNPKDDAQAPYKVEVSVQGVVRIHLTQPSGQMQERRVRAFVNGVSLLYGVVREMVSNITSRSRHGQMLLPSLNFSDLAQQMPDEIVAAPASKPKAAVRKAPAAVKTKSVKS